MEEVLKQIRLFFCFMQMVKRVMSAFNEEAFGPVAVVVIKAKDYVNTKTLTFSFDTIIFTKKILRLFEK